MRPDKGCSPDVVARASMKKFRLMKVITQLVGVPGNSCNDRASGNWDSTPEACGKEVRKMHSAPLPIPGPKSGLDMAFTFHQLTGLEVGRSCS